MNFRNLFYLLWIAFCIGADGKRQLWGEITLNIIGRQDEVKYRLPFFTRQSIIPFPSVRKIISNQKFLCFTFDKIISQ